MKISVTIQRIMAISSFTAGWLFVFGAAASEVRVQQLPYLHYYYGVNSGPDNIIHGIMIIIGLLVGGGIGFFAIVLSKKDIFRWLAIIGTGLSLIVFVYGNSLGPGFCTYFAKLNQSEYTRYEISGDIRRCKESTDIRERDKYIQEILKFIPYRPEGYKSGLSFEEQRLIITEIDEWWRINKNYVIYEHGKCWDFKIDEEAKTVRIWTDEYRKTHPWPKEKQPDNPKEQKENTPK